MLHNYLKMPTLNNILKSKDDDEEHQFLDPIFCTLMTKTLKHISNALQNVTF